jgi:hypothetical protein
MESRLIIPLPIEANRLVKLLSCFDGEEVYVEYKKSHLNVTTCIEVKENGVSEQDNKPQDTATIQVWRDKNVNCEEIANNIIGE